MIFREIPFSQPIGGTPLREITLSTEVQEMLLREIPFDTDIEVDGEEEVYYPFMDAVSYTVTAGGTNDIIILLPSKYNNPLYALTDFKTHFFYPGDGGDGTFTQVTNQSLSGSGTSYSGNFSNPSSSIRVAWGTVVVKDDTDAIVARGVNNTTIIGEGITGTMSPNSSGGSISLTFDSAPGYTPKIDYTYSPVFEAGAGLYVSQGDLLDDNTIFCIVHNNNNNINFSTARHWDDALAYVVNNYRVDTNRVSVSGLSRGAFFARQLSIDRPSEICAFIMSAGNATGTVDWTELYDRGYYVINGQDEPSDGITPPHGSNLNQIGGSHSSYRFYPYYTILQGTRHTGTIWNTNTFNRSTAPIDWVVWISLWSLDLTEQCTSFVDYAESTLDIDDYRMAYRAVSFMDAGSAKTALEGRLSALKTTIDGGRRRWYIDLGATSPVTPGVRQASNCSAGQNYNNLDDDEGNSSTVSFGIVNQIDNAGSNRVQTNSRTAVAGFGYAREEYFDSGRVSDGDAETAIFDGSFKWGGLNGAKTYKLTIYAMAASTSLANDVYLYATIGGQTKNIYTHYTNTRKLTWTGLEPDGSNEIVATNVNNTGGTATGAIQVIMLEEEN